MSMTVYKIGFQHGAAGIVYLHHREGKPYAEEKDNRSYFNGYRAGSMKPQRRRKRGQLDKMDKKVEETE